MPAAEQLPFLRHKERKFGRGCIDQWRAQQNDWLKQLEQRLLPFEEMLAHQPFLLGEQPRFVDFDLFGMLGNFLYSGHYQLPAAHPHIKDGIAGWPIEAAWEMTVSPNPAQVCPFQLYFRLSEKLHP